MGKFRKSVTTVPSATSGPRNRRFTFKSHAERIDDLSIDIIRSLNTLKAEPTSTSFFLDCLIEWRELNTAKDFISFYEEMMPLVQTLPLVFLHKDMLISELLSRLRSDTQLSLEPILRLIAELSRDLQEDFIPFLPKIIGAYLSLLKGGADREPDIIEQIFISWSYIIMYLQKVLTRDVIAILKITVKLRYYPKDFIREFMAKPLSFLLRNASKEVLEKCVAKILCEAARKPSEVRISGASVLLWHVMRGTSSNFHSKAARLIQLLLKNSTLSIGDRFFPESDGSDTVTEIVSTAFQRACTELNTTELMWESMYKKINICMASQSSLHLCRLLSVLISIVSVDRGKKVSDYKPVLHLVGLLVQTFMVTSSDSKIERQVSEVADKILELMLCILDGLYSSHILDSLPQIALQWALAFQLKTSMFPMFLKELVTKDYALLAFRNNILSGLSNLLEMSKEEGVLVMFTFCERLQIIIGSFNVVEGTLDEVVLQLCHFLKNEIGYWEELLNNVTHGDESIGSVKDNLALIWGIIRCIPYFLSAEGNLILMKLVDSLDKIVAIEADSVGGVSKEIWQSLIGASVHSYQSAVRNGSDEVEHTSKFLGLAKKYRSSRQILSAVADYLDLIYGSVPHITTDGVRTHPELTGDMVKDALSVFSKNLYNPDKEIRVSTLRILCHYEHLNYDLMVSKHIGETQMDMMVSHADTQFCNVFKLLLTIEETPVSVATSRTITLLVSRIQTCLSDTRTSECYVLPAFYGIIGLLHNRFRDLSNSAMDCLSVTMSKYPGLLWDMFINYFEQCLAIFLKTLKDTDGGEESTYVESFDKSNYPVGLFGSFCDTGSLERSYTTMLILLLQALQKFPHVVESRFRQMVPLFLRFMSYRDENPCVGIFDLQACTGKDWKLALVEWLNLLKLMKNARSYYRSQLVKDVLVNRLLDDNDADVQMKVLDCLLNWKDVSVLPYEKHLKNLASSKFLREELATWSLSKESNLIEEEHRSELIPLVTRLLMPKVRNLRTLASRKHASVNNRKAVLGFIAQLTVDELPLFFSLLMKSLQIAHSDSEDIGKCIWGGEENSLDVSQSSNFLDLFTIEKLLSIPWKKRYGFLHVVEEILHVFDATHVKPFLSLLMGCVVRLLESCASSLQSSNCRQSTEPEDNALAILPKSEGDDNVVNFDTKQFKEMRSLCLKIICFGLNKYEDYDFGSAFWDIFFNSVKPLVTAFKQEGSSSEKPSSLFFCFLAMSQSQALVSLLCREKNLIPDIFSILSVPTASEAILTGVLKFTENLLTLEVEHGMEIDGIRDVLVSNFEGLIDSLHHLFHNNTEQKRKLLKHPGKTVLRVFKFLSKFIKDESSARKFVDILLPLASDGTKNSDICLEAIQIFRDVVPVLGCESTSVILNCISPVLISARLDLRLSICELFDILAESDSSISSVAKLLHDLNAMSMGDLDFDVIIGAYEKISAEYFYGFSEEQALVILSHCIYDMTSEEIILRQSAYRSLVSFVEFSARIIGTKMDEGTEAIDNNSWTDACIQRVVNKFLLKHMGIAMSKETTLRKEWIDLLHEMVLKLSEISTLRALNVLCSEDAEKDFFNNIVHLQKHRRSRAWTRFSNIFATEKLPEFILKRIFLPLLFNMLHDLPSGKEEHIRSACLDAIASVSGQLGWKSYNDLLMRCFKEIARKPEREKVLVRLICSILDQFHFQEACSDTRVCSSDVMEDGAVTPSTNFIVRSCLTGTVLPKLQKLLVSDPEKVNVNISVAILKVLKLLPGDTMDSHLSSIIHRISNFLKNRLESIRDEARSALTVCLKELGVDYLKFVVKILMATLKRGFELHVLGYTVNFILSRSLGNSAGGELDHCLDELLSVVSNDIFGDVAEQKEVDKIASKMKETKKQKSFETLKLVAQNVTFKTHHLKLLSPLTAHMQKHLTPKVKSKLETMLTYIAQGVEENPSVDQTDLFIFIYSLIEDWLGEETRKRKISVADRPDKEKEQKVSSRTAMQCYSATDSQCSYLISVFALGMFNNRMKNIDLKTDRDQVLSMLDPFVKLLTNCLTCKYEEIIAMTLKCIIPLVRLPLPSLESQADKIKVTLLNIAHSSYDMDSLVTQSCLKLLTALLHSEKVTLSNDQLHVLVQFPIFVDLEKNPSSVALNLLKAIVQRKLVVPEIYDIVIQVSELMVTSQAQPIRKQCSEIFLQFLLNYQLKQKRREEHIDFLLAGLRYEHASGREAVLDMLKTIIKKFPDSIINDYSQTFFIHLVLALANDNDSRVRSSIGIVIKVLITRISPQALGSILNDCLAFYLGEKQNLWSTAAQVLGLFAEVMKKGFQTHINVILPVMRRIMISTRAAVNDVQINTLDQVADPFWKETYYSLVLLEKILAVIPAMFFMADVEDIWQLISEFLIHPHPWICDISSRLVALYFEQSGKQEKKLGSTYLTRISRLFLIGASLCSRLMVQIPDKGARKLVKCNIAFVICGIQSLLHQTKSQDPHKFWSSLAPHEQQCCLKACHLLIPSVKKSITESFTCELDEVSRINDDNKDLSCVLVSGLLNTMGKTAVETEDIQCKMILGSFKLIASKLSSEVCQQYAIPILLPIYKLSEGYAGKVVSDDVIKRAEKIRDRLQEKLGSQNFIQAYAQIRQSLGERRQKRKREVKVMAVIDPVRNAKRKMRVSAKHQAHKKRKMMTTKMSRWMMR